MTLFTKQVRVPVLLAVAAVISVTVPLYAQNESDFEIKQNPNNTVTITGYKGTVKNVVIPQTLYGLKVTGIAEKAFWRKGLTGAVLPNTLINIADGAFASTCSGDANESYSGTKNELGSVDIPNSVIDIGKCAFKSSGITGISFGSGVRSIGFQAFESNKIKELALPPSLTVINAYTFKNNEIEKASFGANIKEIYAEAFRYNRLTELALPASLKIIKSDVFDNNQLHSVTLPKGVTIGENAFANNQLQAVTLPNGVTLSKNVFRDNPLNILIIQVAIKFSEYTGNVFLNLPLTRITIPANMDKSFLWNAGFEEGFVNFCINQNRAAKTYFKNGAIWTLSAPEQTPASGTIPEIPDFGTLIDNRDNRTYKTIKIGDKTWMAENLDYRSNYYSCYDNDSTNCDKYGCLYGWDVTKDVCPAGWHLPTRQEWSDLVTTAGGIAAGTTLKSATNWINNANNTDVFGFSALPGGAGSYRFSNYYSAGYSGFWWTATKKDNDNAYYRIMSYYYGSVGEGSRNIESGASVRCVQD